MQRSNRCQTRPELYSQFLLNHLFDVVTRLRLIAMLLVVPAGAYAGDEQWDGQFYSPGYAPKSIYVTEIDREGNLICGGDFLYIADLPGTAGIARWDGTNWQSIGGGLGLGGNQIVYAVAVRGNEIVIGGSFTSVGGIFATNIARWDGTNWHAVGAGLTGGSVRALAYYKGDLIAGGVFNRAGTNVVGQIAQWDGTNWNNMGGGVLCSSVNESIAPVAALHVKDGTLYAGGRFLRAGGVNATNIAQWNGSAWNSIGEGSNNGVGSSVFALTSDDNGTLYVGGEFSKAGTNSITLLAGWSGTNWFQLGQGISRASVGKAYALRMVDGSLFVGGAFMKAGTNNVSGLARWDGTNWYSVPAPVKETVRTITSTKTNVYVGGVLTSVMAGQVNGITHFNGVSWSVLGSGINARISTLRALLVSDDLIAGGRFDDSMVARWDGTSWHSHAEGLLKPYFTSPLAINALAGRTDNVYAAGVFAIADGITVNGVARFASSKWFALGGGLPSYGLCLAVRGTEVFAGHNNGVARWYANNWSQIGEGLNGAVQAICFIGNDLYAGGSFTNSGSSQLDYIARWDGTNWHAVGAGFNGAVRALAAWNGTLYAGGDFTLSGALSANHVASWDGLNWHPMGTGMSSASGFVSALAVSADGTVFAGGKFTEAGGAAATNIASWNGTQWEALGSGVISSPSTLAVSTLAVMNGDLLVGGDFYKAGDKESRRIARWRVADKGVNPTALAPDSLPSGELIPYTVRVANLRASNVTCVVEARIPKGTVFVNAGSGGVLANDSVRWSLALPPGTTSNLMFSVQIQAASGVVALDDYLVIDALNRIYRGSAAYTTIEAAADQLPLLSVVRPAPETEFPILSDVQIDVSANDPDGIRQVDFYDGPAFLGSRFILPYSIVVSNARAGTHPISAVATDFSGNINSTNITFRVARPVNDNFTNRTVLAGTRLTALGVSVDATTEPGEPSHDGPYTVNSVWWTWRAPANGVVTIDTLGSDFSHVLVVYTGNLISNLVGVVGNKSALSPTASKVSFNAIAGTDYQIVVDGGYSFADGHIVLNLDFKYSPTASIISPTNGAIYPGAVQVPVVIDAAVPGGQITGVEVFLDGFSLGKQSGTPPFTVVTPKIAGGTFSLTSVVTDDSGQMVTNGPVTISASLTNDLFANRVLLEGYQFSGFGTTVGAGAESGDPRTPDTHSVWWKWISPVTGAITIMADSAEYSSSIQVFTGQINSGLVPVASGVEGWDHNEVTFDAVAGREYKIWVDGWHFSSGTASGKYRLKGYVNGLESISLNPSSVPLENAFRIQAKGLVGMKAALQASTNLCDWISVSTNVFESTSLDLVDTNRVAFPKRFYRLLLVP